MSNVSPQTKHLSLVQPFRPAKAIPTAKPMRNKLVVPRQISNIIKGLKTGEIRAVLVTALSCAGEIIHLAAGAVPVKFRSMCDPYQSRNTNTNNGNVTFINRKPTPDDELRALGMDYASGEICEIHLCISCADGSVKTRRIGLKAVN